LKEEVLARTMWRARFGIVFGPVVRVYEMKWYSVQSSISCLADPLVYSHTSVRSFDHILNVMYTTQYAPHLCKVHSVLSTLGITCSIFPQRIYHIHIHGISNRTRLRALYHIIFDETAGAVTQCTVGRVTLSIPNVDISLRTKITKIPCEFKGRHGSDWILLSCNMTPRGLVEVYRRFWGICCLHDHGRSYTFKLRGFTFHKTVFFSVSKVHDKQSV
jgi:hypothetical protein